MVGAFTIRRRVAGATAVRAALAAGAAFAAVLAAPDRAAAGPPPSLHELIDAETQSCGKAAERQGKFGGVTITFKTSTQFSVRAAKLLGPSSAACVTRAVRHLVAEGQTIPEFGSRHSPPDGNPFWIFLGKPRPVLPDPADLLPAWRKRDRRALARLLPPGVTMTGAGCLKVEEGIDLGMQMWLEKRTKPVPLPLRKLFLPAEAPHVVDRETILIQRDGAYCLQPLDDRLRVTMRARLDEEGACWNGDVADLMTAPRIRFPAERRYRAVSVAQTRACAIDEAGEIVCCGSPRPSAPPRGPFQQLSVSDRRGCALRPDGSAACWADPGETAPGPFTGRYDAISVAAAVACARKLDGGFDCAGTKVRGDVGGGRAKQIKTDDSLGVCLLRDDGSLACGKGATEVAPLPSPAVELDLNGGLCVLNAAGEVLCAQSAQRGPWGLVSRERFRQIAVTAGFGCGRRADDTVRCWGNPGKDGTLPPPAARFVALDAGSTTICGVRDDKHIVCWGARTRDVYGMDFE
jgi:hypothetical protein